MRALQSARALPLQCTSTRSADGRNARTTTPAARLRGCAPEERVRLGVVAGDQPLDVAHGSVTSSRRAIPATGMRTQSGRLFSS